VISGSGAYKRSVVYLPRNANLKKEKGNSDFEMLVQIFL
jgi:hypothetical protein